MRQKDLVLWVAAISLCAATAPAGTIQVGPTRTYTTVQAGHDAALAGDTIEIDSGTYIGSNGWVRISKNNLTFRGVGPTRPVLDANHGARASKGIFVADLTGAGNLTVENLEFANAWIPATEGKNAAGIRYQPTVFPATLTARNCVFRDNQNGVLTDGGAALDVFFEYCEFNHNGAGDGQSHNMYINNARKFTLQYCYSHDTISGHEVKTRANTNFILYNLLHSEQGSGSRELQLTQGGTCYVIGNVIQQGPNSQNSEIITYGGEGTNANPYLYIVNNTVINQRPNGTPSFIWKANSTAAGTCLVQNNIFLGFGNETLIAGTGGGANTLVTNWITNWGDPGNPIPNVGAGLANIANHDYRLTAASAGAISAGTQPGSGFNSVSLVPVYQYVHSYSSEARPVDTAIDIGAYEYIVPNRPPVVYAGPDQTVVEGQAVQLHAIASDPDTDPLDYLWTQAAGLNVSLAGGASADASFTAPTVATLAQAGMTFTVAVDDGKGGQASDSVNVRVCIPGDANRDDAVDVVDLLALVAAFGSASPEPAYDAACDFNSDATVDVADLITLVDSWGRTLE